MKSKITSAPLERGAAVVLGLGNPWQDHHNTRHNLGARAVTALGELLDVRLEHRTVGTLAKASVGDRSVWIVRSDIDINQSGRLLDAFERDAIDLGYEIMVVHDDITVEFGCLRFRIGGGSGGHKGVESIISKLGKQDFLRLKIGTGTAGIPDIWNYVVQPFPSSEKPLADRISQLAAEAMLCLLRFGIVTAQNRYHGVRLTTDEHRE